MHGPLYFIFALAISAVQDDPDLLDVFPKSTFKVDAKDRGKTRLSGDFLPSKSSWLAGLDERTVFKQELVHTQDPNRSFRLRIGRGGQIYSLRGPFGESVPPSWRSDGKLSSPWNDEVWQFVAVCSKYNRKPNHRPPGSTFFVHGSGIYAKGKARPMYCPLLASKGDESAGTYRMVNWGLIAESPSLHRSPLLSYLQIRDGGAGVIELTWVVHNFSTEPDIVFDFLNVPWGGTRWTSLPYCFWSTPAGRPFDVTDKRSEKERILRFDKLGGWILRTQRREDPRSPSLGLVFGRDRHRDGSFQAKPSIYRGYRAHPETFAEGRKPNEHRNYDVVEAIPGCRIRPGESYFFRVFLVVDGFERAVARCRELVGHVDYGPVVFDPATVPLVSRTPADKGATFRVYSKPVPGGKPLFLLEEAKTGRRVVTTDPYRLCSTSPYANALSPNHPMHGYFERAKYRNVSDGRTKWRGLLGYGLVDRPDRPGT